MKLLWIVLSLVVLAAANETYLPNSKHPDVADKCYLKEPEEFIPLGAFSTPVGVCQKFTCRDDFVIRVDHCTRFTQPADCEAIPEDVTKPFPDCCVKLRCKEDGKEVIRSTTWLN